MKHQVRAKLTVAVIGKLDGELTAFGDERPSFALPQRRLHVTRPAPSLVAAVPVTFIAFDLLWQASRSCCAAPTPSAGPCSTASA
jgi:ATP-dependent DNA ligase